LDFPDYIQSEQTTNLKRLNLYLVGFIKERVELLFRPGLRTEELREMNNMGYTD